MVTLVQLPADLVPPGVTPWLPVVTAVVIGVSVFLLVVALGAPQLRTRRETRVDSIDEYLTSRSQVKAAKAANPAALGEQLVGIGDRMAQKRRTRDKINLLLDRADLPLRIGEWTILQLIVGVVLTVLGFLLVPLPFIGGVVGLALGVALPPLALQFLAHRRAAAFERQLPEVLGLVATALRSGFGLQQALDAVSRDAADPAAKEFSRALGEARIGTDLVDGLEKMAKRMDSIAMSWTVMAIRIQRDVGGNLAETLQTTSKTLRERASLLQQVKTLSAEGRLSAYILIGMPIALFFYMLKVNYAYLSLLWTTAFGIAMLIGGVVMLGIGIVWMRKVVRIEV